MDSTGWQRLKCVKTRHSCFGHEQFGKHAPALRNLADAVSVRNKILSAFEVVESEEYPVQEFFRISESAVVILGGH